MQCLIQSFLNLVQVVLLTGHTLMFDDTELYSSTKVFLSFLAGQIYGGVNGGI